MSYWTLVKPIWKSVSIYDGAEVFLKQYAEAPEASRILFAAHWAQSEIRNGGFGQFFWNSTGMLAPEAVHSFRVIGMPQVANIIADAMARFGPTYPRERAQRKNALASLGGDEDAVEELFEALDESFFAHINSENGGFDAAADRYAEDASG